MIQPLKWKDRTFYKAIHTKTGFLVFARVSHMDEWMAHGELEILAYIRVEAHYIHILESLAFSRLIV